MENIKKHENMKIIEFVKKESKTGLKLARTGDLGEYPGTGSALTAGPCVQACLKTEWVG